MAAPIDFEKISFVEIFPPIGVARTGDSSDYYIGPEIPDHEPIPEGGFKDQNHKVKRQAARFRVYAYAKDGKTVLGEVNAKNGFNLKWDVHVANKKGAFVRFRGKYQEEKWVLRNPTVQGWPNGDGSYAFTDTRTRLIIDPGVKSVEGASANAVPLDGHFYGTKNTPTNVHLGEIKTDDHGRLVFLAGDGNAQCVGYPIDQPPDLLEDFDNNDWVDTVCDGSVTVSVSSQANPTFAIPVKHKATVITAPPKFTSGIPCFTTLYDLIEDVYERPKRKQGDYDCGEVQYYRDIDPLFRGMHRISWTHSKAGPGHGPKTASKWFENEELFDPNADPERRKEMFRLIRLPVKDNNPQNASERDRQARKKFMPPIGGDSGRPVDDKRNNWASLTELQYDRLAKWAKGEFTTGTPIVSPTSFEVIKVEDQPAALTRASLQWSVGAPLYPGIEVHWHAQRDEMYAADTPFRFSDIVKPGDITKGLSLPWHSDFYMCQSNWWPSVRPDDVVSQEYFAQSQGNLAPEELASKLTNRVKWDRGLKPGDAFVGAKEMFKKWHQLGFVAPANFGPENAGLLPISLSGSATQTYLRSTSERLFYAPQNLVYTYP